MYVCMWKRIEVMTSGELSRDSHRQKRSYFSFPYFIEDDAEVLVLPKCSLILRKTRQKRTNVTKTLYNLLLSSDTVIHQPRYHVCAVTISRWPGTVKRDIVSICAIQMATLMTVLLLTAISALTHEKKKKKKKKKQGR